MNGYGLQGASGISSQTESVFCAGRAALLGSREDNRSSGIALITTLMALSLFSLIGLYLSLIAASEIRVADNYESYVRARASALAGLHHGRALLRGLRFDDLLQGPDGLYEGSPSYSTYAKSHAYRSPISWSAARLLDIQDPASGLAAAPDDGILNTGRHEAGDGIILIPATGVLHRMLNPNGPGVIVAGRYFVKASDNNGEPSELAQDPPDNPFLDGDGQILLRSTGVAQCLGEYVPSGMRRNSVVIFEARYRRPSTFELDAPVVVQGVSAEPLSAGIFAGTQFLIQGGSGNYGIAVIDPASGDGVAPAQQILSSLAPDQAGNIQGAALEPSVQDITAAIQMHADKRQLLDKPYLERFVRETMPQIADSAYAGSQNWLGSAPASLGSYDPTLPAVSPVQRPRTTFVNGDLAVDGSLDGGGLLVVTGRLSIQGMFRFSGLILVVGAGELEVSGWSNIAGGILVASLMGPDDVPAWGAAKLSFKDGGRITYDREAILMAVRLIPPIQLSFREITSIIDP